MKSMYVKIGILVLIAGLLSACRSQSTAAPTAASQPTEQVSPATAVPTEAAQATEAPATAAPATQPAAQGTTVSFTNDVLPIIESRCINCHGGERTEKGLSLKTYSALMAGSENGLVVAPGDATHSKLVELIINQKMPKRGPKLTPLQVETITDWVNQGAPDN